MRTWMYRLGFAVIAVCAAVVVAAGVWAIREDPEPAPPVEPEAEPCDPRDWVHLGGCTVIHIDRDGDMTVQGEAP